MAGYQEARKRIEVSAGEFVRIIRELQELSQDQFAELTGIPESTISAIERDRVKGGIERAVVELAKLRDSLLSDTHPSAGTRRQSSVPGSSSGRS
jgi:DNA-binding XRE family transcriptional regulator